ncbi:MAG: glycosyltransferase family 4 protein [Methylovirgula sp.]
MRRSIAYDVTHLIHRRRYAAPTGIEKVDLAFADYFSRNSDRLCGALHYGFGSPIIFDPTECTSILNDIRDRWREDAPLERDLQYQNLRAWLLNDARQPPRGRLNEGGWQRLAANSVSIFRTAKFSILQDRSRAIPKGAIYLNIAQYALEIPIYFQWLYKRQDLQKVFFIHDLLPLDHPEFWPSGHRERFERRMSCALKYGTAFITASNLVRDRLHTELKNQGRRNVPIFAGHLPTPNAVTRDIVPADPDLANASYFLVIGTLEPRKNHLLLLNIWRELVASGGEVPKLVFVGKRGWTNEQLVSVIERATHCRSHVAEVSGLVSSSIRELLLHAKGVLVPSEAEGFGLPIVESLSAGVPVVASDIPVFREVALDCAIFHHPLDGLGWLKTIRELSNEQSDLAKEARAAAARFTPTSNQTYFDHVEDFLGSLA